MSRYLLVDSSQALACACDLFGKPLPTDIRIVAATASGILACEQARVAYTTIDRFSSRKEIIDLGWRNYSGLTDFCECWDQVAQEEAPCLRERGIKPFRHGYYDFKILIDSIAAKILLLHNFVQHIGNQDIYFAPEQQREIVSGELLRPRKDMNIFSVLLEAFFGKVAQLKPLPLGGQVGVSLSFISYAGVADLAKRVRDLVRNISLSLNREEGCPFLLFNSGHDIGYILPILRGRGYYPIHISPSKVGIDICTQTECNNLWITLCGSPDFVRFFSCGYFGYFPLVEQALKNYVKSVLPRAVAHYDQTQQSLTKSKPAFSLTGTINLGLIQRCRMLAAQSNGALLVTYTEGAGYGGIVSPIYDYTEACDGDAMLCYGTGNIEYYEDIGFKTKPMIPVGSAHQDAVRKYCKIHRPPRKICKIMYVGTAVHDNIVHLPNNGLMSTYYFVTQLKIFRLLTFLPEDIQVIAKPHPSDFVTNKSLKLQEFQRIKVETGCFENVMDGIDLFILDFPSTVLLSAISTSAYIFLLNEEGVSGFTRKQQARLEMRAYLFEQFCDLSLAVSQIVSDISLFPTKIDDEYMLAYSLCQLDGKAANRAVDAIEHIITR